jgi:hypothetical protein
MAMTLVLAIAHVEGWGITGDIPTRDNNPGDIIASKFATQQGATGVDPRAPKFAVFATVADGLKAESDLLNEHYAGMTLRAGLNKYAPPSDGNDDSAYLEDVIQLTGMDADTILTAENIG